MNNIFKFALMLMMFCTFINRSAHAQDNPFGTETVNHIGLAVSKLDESVSFFVDTLGWEKVGGDPDYPAVFVANGKMMITLWQVEDPATATPFHRRKNIGLHHLAITVESLEKLHALYDKIKNMDNIHIEFAPEHMGNGPTTHMMINEPSGIRLEFIVPGGRIRN
ncbi:VOC family protein [Pseudemcibacter aquimaris]|uniref:VOC family protein n=1 Tax=Pseudemcibacter aquimaris TaxID=2857064 RepID=UPI002012F2EC|nr:VOC family protein [Pseudemcibacter aquimaris]MCC3859937.1 VOC family protein [Pseudemcibacter aquimaris]WDU57269.1 VOC family protein [Pseudemcibacter aquimaris]